MDLKHRLTSFVILHSGWLVWLLVGLSTGGLMSVLQRVVALLSTSPGVRRFATRYLLPSRGGLFNLPDADGQPSASRFN